MSELTVRINTTDIPIKEYNGQRVVTLREIDTVHGRPEGTARKRFNDNKTHFIENTDYFTITQPYEIRTLGIERPQGGVPEKVTLITESGYLMIVKSLTDDLAWMVQRQLVNTYFRATPEQRSEAAKTVTKPMTDYQRKMVETRERNSRIQASKLLAQMAERYKGTDYEQILNAHATKELTGEFLLPLPELAEKTYSAEGIGKILGVSANMIGRIANKHGLKTEKYGKQFKDKAKYCNKEVSTFRYYESAIPVFRDILETE